MRELSSVEKIKELTKQIEQITGENYDALTSAIQALKDGYGNSDGVSGGAGRIIDVIELPTEDISEKDVYRLTEKYNTKPNDLYMVTINEKNEIIVGTLADLGGIEYNLNIVEELPDDMKILDLEVMDRIEIYLLLGIGYVNVKQLGIMTIGELLLDREGFDKGFSEDPFKETEMGIYATLEENTFLKRWFIYKNNNWKEISSFVNKQEIGSKDNIVFLSGEYIRDDEILATKNGAVIDLTNKILTEKKIPIIKIDTPDISSLIEGTGLYNSSLIITDDFFKRKNGTDITKIRAGCFMNCIIDELKIPETIYSIEDYAFYNCTAFSIILPNSINTISKKSFGFSDIYTFSLPESIKKIEEYAFEDSNFKQTELPSNLERIEDHAFDRCTALKTITLPKSLNYIGNEAFMNCSSLQVVTFSSKPEFHNNYSIFSSCDKLTLIRVPWSEGEVPGAPWGAPEGTLIKYNYNVTN